ncbi:MAG: hypothetical protein EBS19_15955, partial [Spirochaetia bacterium]|nr:hypothetical protein [Spirochaetia bacterium]
MEPEKHTTIPLFNLNDRSKKIFREHKGTISTQKEFFIKEAITSNFLNKNKLLTEEEISSFNFIGTNFKLSDEQKEALILSLENRFFILTGGPGTGKTTTAAAIIYSHLIQYDKYLNILICAPTGRAAGRITESLQLSFQNLFNNITVEKSIKEKLLNLKASTIHRLLSYSYSKNKFYKNKEYPLIVD